MKYIALFKNIFQKFIYIYFMSSKPESGSGFIDPRSEHWSNVLFYMLNCSPAWDSEA
jgi:hypothetical protein